MLSKHFLHLDLALNRRPVLLGFTVGELILFCLWLLLCIRTAVVLEFPISVDVFEWGSKASGKIIIYNVACLLLLPAKKANPLFVFGVTQQSGINWHKFLGVFVVVLSVMHSVLAMVKWALYGPYNGWSMRGFEAVSYRLFTAAFEKGRTRDLWGLICLLIVLAIFPFTAYHKVRKFSWELFTTCHTLFGLGFIFAMWQHYSSHLVADCLFPAMMLTVVDYLVRGCTFMRRLEVQHSIAMGNSRLIRIKVSRGTQFNARPGQYVRLLRGKSSLTQLHPYSIVSNDLESFTVAVKSLGSWSSSLVHGEGSILPVQDGEVLWVEGPIGGLQHDLNLFGSVFLVAGGSGATPMFLILQHLLAGRYDVTERATMLWVVRQPEEAIVLLTELRDVSNMKHKSDADNDQESGIVMQSKADGVEVEIQLFVTTGDSIDGLSAEASAFFDSYDSVSLSVKVGHRPDIPIAVETERQACENARIPVSGVVTCGPKSLQRDVLGAVNTLNGKPSASGHRFFCQTEQFAY
mmetsp:Transcript_20759/g.32506  ORF Transcript_20759/g.32506 Transcript_20759/m.32506 type:complete len:519 (-) Transcript_20759:441-1997(-)|eukprot:CAMPEP_0184304934 /NCGR_PEP_ID=MMETSP1049-20130417/14325_1 /TAXON_ID=77928 /ORGANISM="Proteomonas sulcata, Strain CCMP704" /LENGTH=518 /DNA_ID=CAMNT_0026616875 /DNA_START=158 /DNA_END=1714 /DNA_ORIENTATION=-